MPEGCEALLEQAYFEARGHKNRLAARTSRARAKARSEKLEADNSALHHENTQLLEQLTVARERLEVLQRENAELSARTLHGAAMQERSPIADLAFKAWTISNETATGCISPLWPADNDDGMNYASYASPRNLGSEHHHLDLLNEMAEDEENPKALFDRD